MIKECLFAIFYFEKEDESIIDEVCEYFDNHCKDVMDFFGIKEVSFKTAINIIPTKEKFDVLFEKEFGFAANKSSRGMCKKDGSINYLSINDYKNTTHAFDDEDYDKALEGFKKTLVHEFVHFINKVFNKENKCGFSATYLTEGIAVYLSKQKENQVFDFDFTVDDLLTHDTNKRKYYAYYLIVKYLIENYDKSLFFDMLRDKVYAEKFLKEKLYSEAKKYYKKCEERR